MAKKECNHIWWHRTSTSDYVCEKCGVVVKDEPPRITFDYCKNECKKYPCKLGCSIAGEYNEPYQIRNGLNNTYVFLTSCPGKQKLTSNPGGFIDTDGKHYSYKPLQSPSVGRIPMNVEGSGGLVHFTSRCTCCGVTTGHTMWEPQIEEFRKSHPNRTLKIKWVK
jgi:hypothetical protein